MKGGFAAAAPRAAKPMKGGFAAAAPRAAKPMKGGFAAAADAVGRCLVIVLVWFHRLVIRPLFPATCRFEPSCSEYALQAVSRFGTIRGGWLALKRLGRCNPWGPWGDDPVPQRFDATGCGHGHSDLRREHP
jgi:putative membrane protein insertion efficiency factor